MTTTKDAGNAGKDSEKGIYAANRALVAGVLACHTIAFLKRCEELKEKGMVPPGDIVLTPINPVCSAIRVGDKAAFKISSGKD